MKRVEKCTNEDCIPTPSSCKIWDDIDIPTLGICNGDSLNPLLSEIVSQIQNLVPKNLSSFDISGLLTICQKTAPEEITIISILTLLRDNHICLKSYINELEKQLAILFQDTSIKVDLKCYASFNGLNLSITRDELDQLIINVLCKHEGTLDSADTSILKLQEAINEASRSRVIREVQVSTCVKSESLPLSVQVQNLSKEVCDYKQSIGTVTDITDALANTPTDLNPEFGSITGWNASPSNWADNYGNTLLEVQSLRTRILSIENGCCKVTCDDVYLGFTALFNTDMSGIVIKFTKGAGTSIPANFEDCGSSGSITDTLGNIQYFDIVISANSTLEVAIDGLSSTGNLVVNIEGKMCNTLKGIQCNKCLEKIVDRDPCQFCTLTAAGDVIVNYKLCDNTNSNCVDKTVSMATGDVFVLPPYASVTTVSDSTLLSSTCVEDFVEFTTSTTTTTTIL